MEASVTHVARLASRVREFVVGPSEREDTAMNTPEHSRSSDRGTLAGRCAWMSKNALLMVLAGSLVAPPSQAASPHSTDHTAIRELRNGIEAMIAAGELPQAEVLIEQRGKPLAQITAGYADVESRRPVGKDAIYRLYSMSKPITSVAILMLWEQGKLALTDPVSKYLPTFANLRVWDGSKRVPATTVPVTRAVTVEDLLLHRSGLTYEFMGDTPVHRWYRDNAVARATAVNTDPRVGTAGSLDQLVERLAGAPLLHQPGDGFSYGFSTTVLGAIVERASGESLDRYLKAHIFEPLDMKDTTFVVTDEQAKRLVTGYVATADGLKAIDRGPTSEYRDPQRLRDGGGALVGTLADYSHFAAMLAGKGRWHGHRLVKAKTVEAMFIPRLRTGGGPRLDAPFGYGLAIGDTGTQDKGGIPVGAGSWSGSANTYFFADPVHNAVAVLMTNEITPGRFETRTWKLRDALDQAAIKLIRK
jgi:CubicO group peptidase (beta-lactamase class C family)